MASFKRLDGRFQCGYTCIGTHHEVCAQSGTTKKYKKEWQVEPSALPKGVGHRWNAGKVWKRNLRKNVADSQLQWLTWWKTTERPVSAIGLLQFVIVIRVAYGTSSAHPAQNGAFSMWNLHINKSVIRHTLHKGAPCFVKYSREDIGVVCV